LKRPPQPALVKGSDVNVATWQIAVPVNSTPKTPKSRIKIEFANVPSYDSKPLTVNATPGLVQIQDVILSVETANEILADKAVALTARAALKFRDMWDVWFLVAKLGSDREMVRNKFADYGTFDIATKAKARLDELARDVTATAFYTDMKRFLPSARVAQMSQMNLQRACFQTAQISFEGLLCKSSRRLATLHTGVAWTNFKISGRNNAQQHEASEPGSACFRPWIT
jgi:hypothetical protein